MNEVRKYTEYIGLYVEFHDVITNLHKNGERKKKMAQDLQKLVMF